MNEVLVKPCVRNLCYLLRTAATPLKTFFLEGGYIQKILVIIGLSPNFPSFHLEIEMAVTPAITGSISIRIQARFSVPDHPGKSSGLPPFEDKKVLVSY